MCGLAGSWWTMLQQQATGGRHGCYDIMSKDSTVSRCILTEEQSCQISSQSDLKRRSLGFLKTVIHPDKNKNKNNNNKMSSDMGTVPDAFICCVL